MIGLNLCSPNPCNNGNCVQSGQVFTCNCFAGWEGNICNERQNVNACSANPCVRGTCIVDGGSFRCQCPSDYIGQRCETYNACYSNPCKNGGSCSRIGRSFSCTCSGSWSGSTCELSKLKRVILKLNIPIQVLISFFFQ